MYVTLEARPDPSEEARRLLTVDALLERFSCIGEMLGSYGHAVLEEYVLAGGPAASMYIIMQHASSPLRVCQVRDHGQVGVLGHIAGGGHGASSEEAGLISEGRTSERRE